jgi:ketosteroid isomerase-like protein
MRHWAWSAMVVAACLAGVACQQRAALTDEDRAAIQKAHDEFEKMIVAASPDPTALVKMYYADNARVLPPNMPAADGQAAIIQSFKAMGQARTFKNGPLTIDGRGDLAYVEATYEGTFIPPGATEPVADKGKFIEVWQKQADGTWKATRDIWNSDTPPPGLALPTGSLKADASPELKKLDWFAGRWAEELESRDASPLGPGGKSTMIVDCRWFAGGTSMFCTTDGATPAGPYHDVMVYTYDAEARAYRGFDADSMGPAAPFLLTPSTDGWTFSYELKSGGKPLKLRLTLFNLSKDACSMKQEVATGGGPFVVVGEGTAQRLPG